MSWNVLLSQRCGNINDTLYGSKQFSSHPTEPISGPWSRSTSNLCLNDTSRAVSVSWDPVEQYYPNMTFILHLEEVTVVVVGKVRFTVIPSIAMS